MLISSSPRIMNKKSTIMQTFFRDRYDRYDCHDRSDRYDRYYPSRDECRLWAAPQRQLHLVRIFHAMLGNIVAIVISSLSIICLLIPVTSSAHAEPIGSVVFIKDFTRDELAHNSSGKITVADLGIPISIDHHNYLLFGDNFESRQFGSSDALSGTHRPSIAIGYSENSHNVRLTGPAIGLAQPLFDSGDYYGKPIPDTWQVKSELPAGAITVPGQDKTLILTNTVINLTPVNSRFTVATTHAPWATVPHSQQYLPGLDLNTAYTSDQWIDMPDHANSQISRSIYYRGSIYFFAGSFKRRTPARLIRINRKYDAHGGYASWEESIIDRNNWQQLGLLGTDRVGEMDFMQLGPQEFAFTYYNASLGAVMLRTAKTIWGIMSAPDVVIVKDARWPRKAEQVTFPMHEGDIAMAQCYGGYMASFDPSRRLLYVVISQWHTDQTTNSPYRSIVFSVAL